MYLQRGIRDTIILLLCAVDVYVCMYECTAGGAGGGGTLRCNVRIWR